MEEKKKSYILVLGYIVKMHPHKDILFLVCSLVQKHIRSVYSSSILEQVDIPYS